MAVTLSGGASYTIPIAVPPGINGVVPQISLSYNSQSGVGSAG
ncbi:SpvB/TcaC N-terminal domain-containing protein [Flavobacterium gyeonganense]|nr:SpvB/TcaC N-terminal domain-containing protein [Flavobacterium gyeonganense]